MGHRAGSPRGLDGTPFIKRELSDSLLFGVKTVKRTVGHGLRLGLGKVLSGEYIDERWFQSDDEDALEALGLAREEVFPFDWSYEVRVANDVYRQ